MDLPVDTFELGWAWNENKQDFTTAKIKQSDRATHFYVVGASGSGKSKFLEYMMVQDIARNGFGVIDPHGDLVDTLKGWLAWRCETIREERGEQAMLSFYQKIVVIDPTNPTHTVAFNPLERQPNISSAEQALELVGAFKKIWHESWGPRLEEILRNSLIVLIENDLTLLELPQLLTDQALREHLLANTQHPIARQYFESRFNRLTAKTRNEWIESTLNKVNAFLADDRIRQMLSSPKSTFNLREIIDNQKILLIKLNKGRLKDNADLLGALLVNKIQMAVLSRSDIPLSERTPFYLYIDEFQNFATDTFVEILCEARKYGLSLVLAHQNLQQLTVDLQASVLANTGIQTYFRVNRQDAELLAKECFATTGMEVKYSKLSSKSFDPEFFSYQEEWEKYFQELQTLEPRFCYVKHKREGGIVFLRTEDMPSLWQEAGFSSEQEWQEVVDGRYDFGYPCFVSRGEVVREYQKRIEFLNKKTTVVEDKVEDFRE